MKRPLVVARKEWNVKIDNVLLGILAIIAGVLILFNLLSVSLVIGIYLIVFGIITLMRK